MELRFWIGKAIMKLRHLSHEFLFSTIAFFRERIEGVREPIVERRERFDGRGDLYS